MLLLVILFAISIMISTSKFYAAKHKARYTTLSEACGYASSHSSRNIVLLPPESDNVYQDSDTENVADNFTSDDNLLEPAGT